MKRKKLFFTVSVITFLWVAMLFSTNRFAEAMTIKGEVNENYQIVTEDGQIYEVADTDKGHEVVLQHVGKSDERGQVITITSNEFEGTLEGTDEFEGTPEGTDEEGIKEGTDEGTDEEGIDEGTTEGTDEEGIKEGTDEGTYEY